jgi:LAO/AO transport system kinase
VIQISALLEQGVGGFWTDVQEFKSLQMANGRFASRRQSQALAWMWERIDAGLKQRFKSQPAVAALLPRLSDEVRAGQLPASTAARMLLDAGQ